MGRVVDNRFRDGVENPTDGWGTDYLWIGDMTEPFTLTGRSKPPQIGSGLPNSSGELGNATCRSNPPWRSVWGVGALAMTRLRRRNS
ncbi:hypothetical protein N39L_54530 [Limnospira platensis NIES-39]|uniref:Uncharacterized protein n=1 Tax=Limnospira platensis NIES-46 TaxID=1236695 RepID=A0A5M3T297_LIMPL|nr:hypothetical protein AP285_25100 [Arthrospira platensis YZ]KDR55349.1 hypothetical protein APPUASWS_023635 [Arthrospira platensis str. Paraca]BDT15730.1 hypothetical protein N39L_54530 [Arthrospira platensis NIES-39]GCE92565.1 hypothetical protein NIES46_06050 [Arthrospira platensis NIES-46]